MNPNRPPIEWTAHRLDLLRRYYPTMFTDALAKLIGCSPRTLQRKASELGIQKVENFQQLRGYDISKRVSDGVKRAYADGRLVSRFPKGVRFNPDGEFPAGFRFDAEIEAARIEKIRETYRRKKLLKIYGIKS